MIFVDTHCHLDDTRGADLHEVIAAATGAGVAAMITVGCDAATSQAAIDIAGRFPGVYATAGLHPHEARHGVDSITPLLATPGIVAVGECGLDYHYDNSPRDLQRAAFAAQVEVAAELGLPLVVHTREAWADTFDIIDAGASPPAVIFHCFTGGPDEARACLDRGGFLSFSGIVTFPSATDVQAAAVLCPADRLLSETDSPYLAPVPHRGRPNRPAYVTDVVAALARLRGMPLAGTAEAIARAARAAFPALAGVA